MLALEPKALDLLALMVRRPGHLFTKQEIFDAIWPDTAVTDHALTRVVSQLRRVLGDEAREARYLETVPTRGYRWSGGRDVQTASPPRAGVRSGRSRAGAPGARASPAAPDLPVQWPGDAVLLLTVRVPRSARRHLTRTGRPTRQRPRWQMPAARIRRTAWPVQLTTHDGLDLQPALSPLGDALAFASDRSGGFEIYVRALGGARATSRSPATAVRTCSRPGRPTADSSRITRTAAAASG